MRSTTRPFVVLHNRRSTSRAHDFPKRESPQMCSQGHSSKLPTMAGRLSQPRKPAHRAVTDEDILRIYCRGSAAVHGLSVRELDALINGLKCRSGQTPAGRCESNFDSRSTHSSRLRHFSLDGLSHLEDKSKTESLAATKAKCLTNTGHVRPDLNSSLWSHLPSLSLSTIDDVVSNVVRELEEEESRAFAVLHFKYLRDTRR